jgi:hypothetical protein
MLADAGKIVPDSEAASDTTPLKSRQLLGVAAAALLGTTVAPDMPAHRIGARSTVTPRRRCACRVTGRCPGRTGRGNSDAGGRLFMVPPIAVDEAVLLVSRCENCLDGACWGGAQSGRGEHRDRTAPYVG